MRSNIRALFSIVISAGCLALIPYVVPFHEILRQSRHIELSHMIVAFGLVAINTLLSSVRFHGMMKSFHVAATLRVAHKINILSQIFGIFAFQVVGQMIFRTAYGGRHVGNPHRLAPLTLVEKLISLLTMSLIGLGGFLYITSHIGFGGGGVSLVVLGIATSVSVVLSYWMALTAAQRRYSKRVWRWLARSGIERAALLSLVMHGVMLLAYVVVASGLLGDAPLSMIAALLSVVMLGAAIPVSFAGWGIRELSAGFVFSMLGYDPSIGVVVAASIGLVSLLALGAHAISMRFLPKSIGIQASIAFAGGRDEHHFERMLALFCGVGIAIFIGFQIRVPTNSGALTVNLADPIAIVAAVSFFIIWFREYLHQAIWRINGLAPAMFFLAAMIAYGWLLGYWENGFSSWSTYNRGIGFFVLAAYLFSGSMVTALLGRGSIQWIIRTFLVTNLSIFGLYVLSLGLLNSETLLHLQWRPLAYAGLFGNRNALAFAVLVLMAVLLATKTPILGSRRAVSIAFAAFLVLISGSRTGVGVGALMFVCAAFLQRISLRELVQVATFTCALVGALFLINAFLPVLYGVIGNVLAKYYDNGVLARIAEAFTNVESRTLEMEKLAAGQFAVFQSERFEGYRVALDMWLSQPVFGVGLGAFIAHYLETTGVAFVVHNTGLWILTEMGLVGLVLFLPLPWAIIAHLRKKRGQLLSWDDCALLFCLIAVAFFSLTHDMLYQRILWFVLGLLAANKLRMTDSLTSRMQVARESG